MEGLGVKLRTEAMSRALTEELVNSGEIEGEVLDRELFARRPHAV
jgi:hypothetical protein